MVSQTIVAVVLLALVAEGAHGQCPSNATFGESCYVMPHSEASWIGAVRYCRSMGGNLAVFETAAEHNFVASLINSSVTGGRVQFHTGNDYVYHYVEAAGRGVSIHGHSSITFMVQACNDAHVCLSATQNSDHDTYEIVIGGWADTSSVIRDCKQCAHMDEVRQQDHPLSCQEARPFWVSWQEGQVRLGAGSTVGEGQMLAWQDPHPHPVHYLGIATGWGATGAWSFPISNYIPGVFWLGMTDLQVEGEWTGLPELEEIEYTHWAQGQPSGVSGRHCAAMDGARGLNWIDADCEIRRNFVCEVPLGAQ